ncbi:MULTISPECIES: LysR family transcriptional regulator [unclassified Rhizobium]|uniref:LysR family transcriptional regulator n=1 Tax=unclassified Rhizobium TaxID=2613769 RepID=UPI00288AC12F|nr:MULTISPECIES: LysR family transcriptional regulator [unclassified Rhizobium]
MRFQGLDLNLLVALDELLTERNLTVAAKKLNLSQPAMSAALSRLRAYFGDELFTMQVRRMVPTPFSETIATPIRGALMQIRDMLASRELFDPSLSERCFRVAVSDYAMLMLFCRVVARISKIAPRITFDLVSFDDNPDELLRRGDVDFLIFPDVFLSSASPKSPLFEDRLVAVACQTNTEIDDSLSFDQFMSMGHVATQFGRSHKRSIEAFLMLEHGLQRRIEVAVPNFALIPHFVVGTNRIGTMCERLAVQAAETLPLKILEFPIPLQRFTESIQWSGSGTNDPAAEWVRNIVIDEANLAMSPFVPGLRPKTH